MKKLIGLLLVGISGLVLSAVKLRVFKRDIANTRGLLLGLRLIRSEASMRISPLPELMRIAACGTDGAARRFFSQVHQGLVWLDERSFADIWNDACRRELGFLSPECKTGLLELGSVLGRTELEDQLAACGRIITILQEKLDDQTKRFPEQRRLTLGLSAAGTCFLCLLLI